VMDVPDRGHQTKSYGSRHLLFFLQENFFEEREKLLCFWKVETKESEFLFKFLLLFTARNIFFIFFLQTNPHGPRASKTRFVRKKSV
jgi:hypothetical protein